MQPIQKKTLLKIGANDLKIGMFVAELDRPWLDTPFLIQGFLIEDPSEVVSLQSHCHYVYVDPFRSAAGVVPLPQKPKHDPAARRYAGPTPIFNSTLAAATGANRTAAAVPSQSPDPLSDTGRFMQMVHSGEEPAAKGSRDNTNSGSASSWSLLVLTRKFLAMLFGSRASRVSLPPPPHHSFIPDSISLVSHPETRTIKQEFPHAAKLFDTAKFVIAKMVADLVARRNFNIDYVWKVIDEFVNSMLRNPDALTWVAMTRKQDATVYGHGIRTAVYLLSLGRHLGLPREYLLRLGMIGVLLDIGKTTLPLALLTKPGKLAEEEFTQVKGHVSKSLELIQAATELHPEIVEGIAQHHEREDGSGYPNGLSGDQIGLFGRMAAIVDSFVALTNERTYAETLSPYAALRKLTEWSRTLFHAPLTEQFIQAIGVFPVGSMVDLSTDEVAVVVRQNPIQRLKPQVLIVRGADKAALATPVFVDLAEEELTKSGPEPRFIGRGLPVGAHHIDGNDLAPI